MQSVIFALFFTLLAMFTKLVPSEDPIARHGLLATATATALLLEEPLYANDDDRTKTAALVAAVEFRESTFRHDARGDCDKRDVNGKCITPARSFCAMQIHDSAGGTAALIDDPVLCVRTGIRLLRQSIRADRAHPIAFYARGPRGLEGGSAREEAVRISDDRVAISKRLLVNVTTR